MPHYKDAENNLHFIDDVTFEHLLKPGCIQISDSEAALISQQETPEQKIQKYESALDAHLDSVAQSHRFKDRHSLALRSGYPSAYQALGTAFSTWMDGCNVQAYQRLQRVIASTEPMPTIEEFINDLPDFIAP